MKVNRVNSFVGKDGGKKAYDSTPMQPEIVLDWYNTIERKELEWLWPGRIPLGKVTVIEGDPDLGKSLITIDIIARVTRGLPFPDGAESKKAKAILLSAEDDAEDTIAPRMDSAGVDDSQVARLTSVLVSLGDGVIVQQSFNLETDCAALERMCQDNPEVRLICIDPVSAYLGDTDPNSNAEVRALLAPLSALAAKYRVAIVLINHFRKSLGPAMYRGIGSIAFTAAPRAVWGVTRDAENQNRYLFLQIKKNVGRRTHGLAYSIVVRQETITDKNPDGLPTLAWEPDPIEISVDDVLAFNREDGNDLREAKQWLKEELENGAVDTKELQRTANSVGIAWRTVQRAKRSLGVKAIKIGGTHHGSWQWELKEELEESAKSANPLPAEILAPLAALAALTPKDGHQERQERQERQEIQGCQVAPLPPGACSHCQGTGFGIADCPECQSGRQCCQCYGLGKEIEIPF